jgi:hypothetical protein
MSASAVTLQDRSSAAEIVKAEQEFALADMGVVLAVIAVAVVYLYRRLWRKRGACAECGNKDGHCQVKQTKAQGNITKVSVDDIGRRSHE